MVVGGIERMEVLNHAQATRTPNKWIWVRNAAKCYSLSAGHLGGYKSGFTGYIPLALQTQTFTRVVDTVTDNKFGPKRVKYAIFVTRLFLPSLQNTTLCHQFALL